MLIKILIEKKWQLYHEWMNFRYYPRAISSFYSCYGLALSALGESEDSFNYQKRNRLWKRYLSSDAEDKKRYLIKILSMITKDSLVVIRALTKLEEQKEKMDYYGASIWKEGLVFVAAYEHPMNR